MNTLYLVKIGELNLKGKNKRFFEDALKRNLNKKLNGIPAKFQLKHSRLYVRTDEKYTKTVEDVLSTTFGLLSFSRAVKTEKDIEAIKNAAFKLVESETDPTQQISFKIESRRSDKSFEYTSYEISNKIGAFINDSFEKLYVNVKKPEYTLNIEIREQTYIYGKSFPCPGGLPVGTAGKAMILLSGGIDSPVAGYMMGKRGLSLTGIYFHTYPYTSNKAKMKVAELAKNISRYTSSFNLYVIPFTTLQMHIKKNSPKNEVTLHSRAFMMHIAEKIAIEEGIQCIITGESLSQVASQTIESIHYSSSGNSLPVLRPLIGLDKTEIIKRARSIGSYEISIQPHTDCCTVFAPEHPLIRPKLDMVRKEFNNLYEEQMVKEAVENRETILATPLS